MVVCRKHGSTSIELYLVDEGGLILIDEARTPLIVSGQTASDTSQLYHVADEDLRRDLDYIIDVPPKTIRFV